MWFSDCICIIWVTNNFKSIRIGYQEFFTITKFPILFKFPIFFHFLIKEKPMQIALCTLNVDKCKWCLLGASSKKSPLPQESNFLRKNHNTVHRRDWNVFTISIIHDRCTTLFMIKTIFCGITNLENQKMYFGKISEEDQLSISHTRVSENFNKFTTFDWL